jgi:ABC-type uncharacterized transport system substrate-binding protein
MKRLREQTDESEGRRSKDEPKTRRTMERHLRMPIVLIVVLVILGLSATKKTTVLYINSYHQGYAPSDEIFRGIRENLPTEDVDLHVFYMDTKRNGTDLFALSQSRKILRWIIRLKPAIILTSDDNAVKFCVIPHLMHKETPVVFCGVNWDCSQYGLPVENITGIVEVLPLRECVQTLKSYYPGARKLTVLSEQSLSEKSNATFLDTLSRHLGLEVSYRLVKDFGTWKINFANANDSADFIYVPTNGAIKNWDKDEAIEYVSKTIKTMVFTCDDFMMPYAVFALAKVPYEQGEWTARTAKQILNGVSPSQIPIAANRQTKAWLNTKLAEKIGFRPKEDLLVKCDKLR